MSKQGLLHDSEINIIKSDDVIRIQENPISQYNYVIKAYNVEYCMVDNTKLKTIPESFLYCKLFPLMKSPLWSIFLGVVLLVVPIINIFTYGLIIFAISKYLSGLIIFRQNSEKVNNPFRNMIFSAEICESMKKINWGFDIAVSGFFII